MLDVLDVMTRLGEVKNKTAEALRAAETGSASTADSHLAICILKTEV